MEFLLWPKIRGALLERIEGYAQFRWALCMLNNATSFHNTLDVEVIQSIMWSTDNRISFRVEKQGEFIFAGVSASMESEIWAFVIDREDKLRVIFAGGY